MAAEEATAAAVAVVAEEAAVMEVVVVATAVATAGVETLEEVVAPTAVADPLVNSKCCFNIMTLLPLSFPVDL